jgi:hypothetical protein
MAELQPTPPTLTLRLTRAEKILGMLRDVVVPLTAVDDVEAVTDPLAATRGLRAPGLALPGLRKIGTWRARGERALVCVRAGRPAVRVRLSGQRYDTLLVEADDATALAAQITAARSAAG